MSFNISAWSIKKPVPTIVLFLILTVVGWFSFMSLGIDTNPNIDVPAVAITVTQPGAGPAELESQVTKKIEDAVAGLGNIDNMISTVSDGSSKTTINFVLGTNSDRATNDVRNAIAQIRQSLPQDINDPIVQRLDFAGGPIITYAVKSDQRSVAELSNLVDQTISRALLAVKGVAQIQRVGGVDREVRINLNPDRLQSLGITATQVNDQIRALNINLPGGRAEVGGSEQSIRTLGSAKSVNVLQTYEILLPQGGSVPLSSLGTIEDKYGDVHLLKEKPHSPSASRAKMRLSQLFQLKSPQPRRFQPYKLLLQSALRHRLTTMAIALAFFVASLMLVPLIPKGFVDDGDFGISTMAIELPPGSTLEDVNKVVTQTTDFIQENPAVEQVLATAEINAATLTVQLKPKEARNISQKQFEAEVRPLFEQIPGARISFQSQSPGDNRKGLSIVLRSEDPQALNQTAETLEKQMRAVSGLVDVASTASLVKPEILVIPNPQRAADLGVTVQAIARTASLATIGDNDSNLAKFNLSDRQIPIRVQIAPQARADINTLKNLQVPSQNGGLVPLIAVADIRFGSGPATIKRYDRARQVAVEANLQGISLGAAVQTVNNLPALQNLPPGVAQRSSGSAKIMQDIFSRFGGALALAVMCIYAILVLLYNNFLHPVSIMAALPFCLGGALVGLMVAQKPLGIYALIGIVLLLGIVTKNSILLVDYAIINMQAGKTQRQALIESGVSRLRPIMMTSLATIAGTLPLALGIGAGSEVRQPMGIAIMGGFTTSTLLTLVVVPVIFTYIDDWQNWIKDTWRYGFRNKRSRHLVNEQVNHLLPEREETVQ